MVTPDGLISTVLGTGRPGFSGEGGPATKARIFNPESVAIDSAGNLFVLDGSRRVRRVTTAGVVTTIAGNGEALSCGGPPLPPATTLAFAAAGEAGPATAVRLVCAYSIAVDRVGNLFIADTRIHVVRRVSRDGVLTTVAGNGTRGSGGDGGPATAAQLDAVHGLALDVAGNLFIADTAANRVRKVSPTGLITTFAGGGR
jgi:hypothetical protein